MIKIKNKNTENPSEEDVYIGRGSVFGNPYFHGESSHKDAKFKTENRKQSIDRYLVYFEEKIREVDPIFYHELNKLIIKNLKNQNINLSCFCAPLSCHGDIIKDFIINKRFVMNWFSNMFAFKNPLVYQGVKYFSVENFYQAMKTDINEIALRAEIAASSPFAAKKRGREIKIRKDFNEIKIKAMKKALIWKFTQNPDWKRNLLDWPKTEPLIEYNNWGDTFWGVDIFTGKGENNLGKLLSEIKEKI